MSVSSAPRRITPFRCGAALKPDEAEDPDLSRRALTERWTEPAAEWIPDALMLDWVTRRRVILGLREGFDRADDPAERRQLIMTGLKRKGEMPTADSPAARNLVKLCRDSATWWSDRHRGHSMGNDPRRPE